MTPRSVLTDDRAVSPVIGVILMVAITVILGAIIGSFVLGMGDETHQVAPNAVLEIDQNESADEGDVIVTILHDGGDSLDPERINITASGEFDKGLSEIDEDMDRMGAGDEITIGDNETGAMAELENSEEFEVGDEVRIIWESEDDESAILARYEIE